MIICQQPNEDRMTLRPRSLHPCIQSLETELELYEYCHKMEQNSLLTKNGVYMDEALSKTKYGLFNYTIILLSGIALIAVFVETSAITYVIPVSKCDFGITENEKGILGGVSVFGVICSSHLWGYLADTRGRRRVMMPTLLISFLITFVSSFVRNFYLFVALRFFCGFFVSGSSAVIYAYLGEFHDTKHRGRAIMGSAVVYGIECFIVPLVAWLIIGQDWQFDIPLLNVTYKPWRLFVAVCGLPGLLAFIMLLFLPESPKFVLGQGNGKEAFEIVRKAHRINNRRVSELEKFEIYEEKESIENRERILDCKNSRFPLLRSIWIQTCPLFKPPYLRSTVLICVIQFGIYSTSNGFYMVFTDILNKLATNVENVVDDRIAMCDAINAKHVNQTVGTFHGVCVEKLETATLAQTVVLETVVMVGFAIIGIIVNKVGKFLIIFVILIVSGCCGILCMLTDVPIVQICAFIALMSCTLCVNIVSAATVDNYPTALRAMAVCISLMFGRFGSVVGSNTVAVMLENHCEEIFYLSGSTVLAMGLLTYFVPNIHNKNGETSIHDFS